MLFRSTATNDFQISVRGKNKAFLDDYRIKTDKIKEVLLSLSALDCKAFEANNNQTYSESLIYIFLKECEFDRYGEPCKVMVYIKLYITNEKTYDQVIVISFHEDQKDKPF